MLRGWCVIPICLCAAASPRAVAQPANNTCGQNRAQFTVPAIGGSIAGSLTFATRDGSACQGLTGSDVYYYFTPAVTAQWRLSLCLSAPLGFDSVLSIHTDSCPVSPSTYVTPANVPASCNDNGTGCGSLSQIDAAPLTAGTSYIIRVARFAGEAGPIDFTLSVINTQSSGACCSPSGTCQVRSVSLCLGSWSFFGEGTTCSPNPCPQPPPNDTCAAAISLTGQTADVLGTTALAATDGAAACGGTGSRDVWYTFTPDETGAFSLSLCSSAATWNSILSVHSVCPGVTGNQLAGACDDDGCASGAAVGVHALIPSLSLSAGTSYLVRVAGQGTGNANFGGFRLTIGAPLGACCSAADAACSLTTHDSCAHPNVWMQGSLCTATACASLIGACCDPATGACTPTTAPACIPPSSFAGAGVACNPAPCPQPAEGACCAGPCCRMALQAACTGVFIPMVPCSPTACGPAPSNDDCESPVAIVLGASFVGSSCTAGPLGDGPAPTCLSSGVARRAMWFAFVPPANASYEFSTCGSDHDTILTVFQGDCAGLVPMGCNDDAATPCSSGSSRASLLGPLGLAAGDTYLIRVSDGPSEMTGGVVELLVASSSPLGSCCESDGLCTFTDAPGCAVAGGFTPGASCNPNPCAPPLGACCSGAICLATPASACTGAGSLFAGVGLACNQYPVTVGACCLADFNHVSGLSVQDLFDFLAGYFSGNPAADINRSGVISVEDIFNFLDAYFRGGC